MSGWHRHSYDDQILSKDGTESRGGRAARRTGDGRLLPWSRPRAAAPAPYRTNTHERGLGKVQQHCRAFHGQRTAVDAGARCRGHGSQSLSLEDDRGLARFSGAPWCSVGRGGEGGFAEGRYRGGGGRCRSWRRRHGQRRFTAAQTNSFSRNV